MLEELIPAKQPCRYRGVREAGSCTSKIPRRNPTEHSDTAIDPESCAAYREGVGVIRPYHVTCYVTLSR